MISPNSHKHKSITNYNSPWGRHGFLHGCLATTRLGAVLSLLRCTNVMVHALLTHAGRRKKRRSVTVW